MGLDLQSAIISNFPSLFYGYLFYVCFFFVLFFTLVKAKSHFNIKFSYVVLHVPAFFERRNSSTLPQNFISCTKSRINTNFFCCKTRYG